MFKGAKRRGELVELKFMTKAAEHGLEVAKPWGDSARYDFVIEHGGRLLRVQVKSTQCRKKNSYACSVRPNLRSKPYQAGEFDFVAAYVIPEDVWYIIPAKLVVKGKMGLVSLSPGVRGHKYEKYIEAWKLMREG